MANAIIDESSLLAIAGAIREKLGVDTSYLPSQMAAAIGSIPAGGAELTSADEGKVVVESGGSYVLQSQTSRSISQNGTYDTTTNGEVVVSVSGGGGGSTNILSGTEEPTSSVGDNGSIYLETLPDYMVAVDNCYFNTGLYPYTDWSIYLHVHTPASKSAATANGKWPPFFGISNKSTVFYMIYNLYSTRDGVVEFTAGGQTGQMSGNGAMPYDAYVAIAVENHTLQVHKGATPLYTQVNGSGSVAADGELQLLGRNSDYGFIGGIYAAKVLDSEGNVVLDAHATAEGLYDTVREGLLPAVGNYSTVANNKLIANSYLKVDGSWVDLIGQDLDDVNTGGSGGGSSVFTILELASETTPTATMNGVALQGTQDQTDARITRYVIPSSGTVAATNGIVSADIPIVEYLKPLYSSLLNPHFMGVFDASSGTLTCKWSSRSFATVATTGKFVLAIAKTAKNFVAPALYTLTDYGVVGSVISGSYCKKNTYQLTNPNDSTVVTVYAYGGFSGGLSGNVSLEATVGDDVLLNDTANNMEFFGPYSETDFESEPYGLLDDYKKMAFFTLLQQTL